MTLRTLVAARKVSTSEKALNLWRYFSPLYYNLPLWVRTARL